MLNTHFRRGKGVKEINNAIICETYAYVIVACINVKQKCSKSKHLVYTVRCFVCERAVWV